jgi:hypothetical protein
VAAGVLSAVMTTTTSMSQIRILCFGGDCSSPTVEEVGSNRDVASTTGGWPLTGETGWDGVGGKWRKVRMRRRKTDRVGGKRREEDESQRGRVLALSHHRRG